MCFDTQHVLPTLFDFIYLFIYVFGLSVVAVLAVFGVGRLSYVYLALRAIAVWRNKIARYSHLPKLMGMFVPWYQ